MPQTTVAAVDQTFIFIMAFAFLLFALIIFLMVYFVIRYRRSRSPKPTETRQSPWLEVGWTTAALIIVVAMFFSGLSGFEFLRRPPSGAMRVTVTARQWSWLFAYENGLRSAELVVPQGKPVSLALVSQDVIHSFYVPALRIKQDVVPGMTTRAWFSSSELGSFDVLCAEYCGTEHSQMRSKVIVIPEVDWQKWYVGEEVEIPGVQALTGQPPGLIALRHGGCLDCHSVDGSQNSGPTFKGLAGSRVEVITGGTRRNVTADEEYIRTSILRPEADIVVGYKDIMPSGRERLSDDEVDQVVEYLEELL